MFQPTIHLKYVFALFLLVLSACSPLTTNQSETIDAAPSFSEVTNTQTETPDLTLSRETIEPTSISDSQTAIPIATDDTAIPLPTPTSIIPPKLIFYEERILEVITQTFTVENAQGTQYSLSEPTRLVGLLPNDELMLEGNNYSWFAFNLNDFVLRPLFENMRPPVYSGGSPERIIFAIEDLSHHYPIWSVNIDGSDPVLLGTTTGYFPRFSVSSDGKTVVIEQGHLVMKWLENGIIKNQPLTTLEMELGINWQDYDLTKPTDYETTPWIDFQVSPDGQKIAIFDGGQTKLWLATIDGVLIKEVLLDPTILEVSGDETWPYVTLLNWSPDSRSIAYREGIWSNNPGINYQQLKIVDVADHAPFSVTSISEGVGLVLTWSPDGLHIAFSFTTYATLNKQQRGADLFVANPDGSQPQKVSETFHSSPSSLFWLSDSHTLLYRCWNGDRFDICKFSLNK